MIISGRFFAYSLIKPDVAFSYTGTGSGAGRRAVRNGLVDFAGSDAPLTASDLQLVSYWGQIIKIFRTDRRLKLR